MLMNLSDYRFILDGLIESHADTPPSPSIVRYMLEWWPETLLRPYSILVAKHESSGETWQSAEWLAFKFFALDTKRHDEKNPDKKIQWRYPSKSEQVSVDESNIIQTDEHFFSELQRGADYNNSLGPSAKEQLDAAEQDLKQKLKETEIALKSGLSLEKQTTVKKRSTVKKEPSVSKEPRSTKKKSKFDSGMGALFS
jgi:hypothetical protein